MHEKRILIASLLKPINDTRMFEKLGLSLSKRTDVQVHICGYQAPVPAPIPDNLFFHPLFRFRRLSLNRLLAQFRFYRLLKRLQPSIAIVCTHELLLPTYLYKLQHTLQLVYDVQENYTLNLREQHNYAPWLKRLLAAGVGSIEKFVAPAVAQFILAEKSYVQELPFIGDSYLILENKYKKAATHVPSQTPVLLQNKPLRLLYSGTIAEEYGVFEAIQLADELHRLAPATTLTIIGYCANQNTLKQVQQQVKKRPHIQMIGGATLVPHSQLIQAIQNSDVGLLPYRLNKSTFRCIPTKLYEYMAHALPILISHNPLWDAIVQKHRAGISINFSDFNAPDVWLQLTQNPFYTLGLPKAIFWDQEEEKLLSLFDDLLSKHQTSTN